MWIISLDVDYVTRIMSVTGLCQSLDYVSHWIMSVTGLCQSLDYVSHWIMSVTGLYWVLFSGFSICMTDSRTSFQVPLLTYLLVDTTGRIPPQRSKVKQLFVRYNSPEVEYIRKHIYSLYT